MWKSTKAVTIRRAARALHTGPPMTTVRPTKPRAMNQSVPRIRAIVAAKTRVPGSHPKLPSRRLPAPSGSSRAWRWTRKELSMNRSAAAIRMPRSSARPMIPNRPLSLRRQSWYG
jgi:hypothetical protein